MTELLQDLEEQGFSGAFAFTFVIPKYPYNDDPQLDLDMASFGVVKSFSDHKGLRYTDMPWEPKQSFDVLGRYYSHTPKIL